MSQRTRVVIVIGVLVVIAVAAAIYGAVMQNRMKNAAQNVPQPNMIHLYVDGKFVANVSPVELNDLPAASFTDAEEGKLQEGWWLHDVVRLYVQEDQLGPDSEVDVAGIRSTTGETKQQALTWQQVTDPANTVIFDLAGNGQSLKLVSSIAGFDTRDTWIQGVSRIDVRTAAQ
jgi:hypothetical protein